MKKLKVQIHLNEPVVELTQNTVITSKTQYKADYIIVCTGIKPKHIRSDRELQKGCYANECCQLEDDNSFAIGDIAFVPCEGGFAPHLGQVAMEQGLYLAKLLRRGIKGKQTKDFQCKINVITSLGRNYALARLMNRVNLYGRFAWYMKRGFYLLMQLYPLKKDVNLIKILFLTILLKNRYFYSF